MLCSFDGDIVDTSFDQVNEILSAKQFDPLPEKVCKKCLSSVVDHLVTEIEQMKSDSGSQFVVVEEEDEEWKMITDLFRDRGLELFQIIRIEKNINKSLLEKCRVREEVAERVKYLFHGSQNRNYDNILNCGFDTSYAKKSGSLGAGIYFAEKLTYSNSYTYGISTEIGAVKNVLLAKVSFVRGSFREGCSIYAVFDNYDAYPEFIIYYQ